MNLPVRLRRLRRTPGIRRLFAETSLEPRHLIQPYFVVPGRGQADETPPRMGLWRISPDVLAREATALAAGGAGGIMLFGVPPEKSDDPDALPHQLAPLLEGVAAVRAAAPETPIFVDVCLCSYTPHGHCGVVKDGEILNDPSVQVLARQAALLARAGADFVCPSDMMDGRVGAIRSALDEAGFQSTGIVSYAVKMASAFYGPFRHAAESAPTFGDRQSYQMPAGNRREARREHRLDEAEGADVLLFKPALTNLDLIRDAREASDLPLFAYQVSGEYAALRAAADQGLLDFDRAMHEVLLSVRRAGADAVVSYHTRAAAGLTSAPQTSDSSSAPRRS